MIKKGIPLYKRDPKILARDLINTNIKMHEYKRRIDKLIEFINSEIEEYNKNIFVTQDMNIYVDGIIQGYQNCLKILGGDSDGM